jgi:archaellum component FlaD/FlaE
LDYYENIKESHKMVEETKQEETKKEEVQETQEKSKIDEARELADRIDRANETTRELVERLEKAKVDDMLGGSSNAGQQAPQKLDETPEEYAKRIMKGELTDEEKQNT